MIPLCTLFLHCAKRTTPNGEKLFILKGLKLGGVKEALVRQAAVVQGSGTNRWRQAECEETHFSLRPVWWRYKHSGRISSQQQVHIKKKINKKIKPLEIQRYDVTLTPGRKTAAPVLIQSYLVKISNTDIGKIMQIKARKEAGQHKKDGNG